MPKNSPSDDITFTTIGQLFEEMHIGMNPKPSLLQKDTGNDDGTTTNLKDCPTPKFYAISPIKYGYLTKQGHNFRSWKVC